MLRIDTSRFASINLLFAVPQTDVYNASATDNTELRKSKKKRDDDDEEDVEKYRTLRFFRPFPFSSSLASVQTTASSSQTSGMIRRSGEGAEF